MMTFRISKMCNIRTTLLLLTTIIYSIKSTESGAVQLTAQNINNTLEAAKVVMGKVDCEKERSLFSKYKIKKYPTLIAISNGPPEKREKYTGERTVEALTTFIKKQMMEVKKLK
ncbi:endoplasmic reticulum resident protein 44-like [Diabrotica virgifera virgifera]|uniref:Thioredoxin domain-containing protein n=1 Tax=Diabrotica virgifera virgifera TaxID=50390 RepID=A0ABM5JZ47_DIAVI|nr:endoplasmic reticulum resident protein 44-like [Diabrotica virgifera virgifera]